MSKPLQPYEKLQNVTIRLNPEVWKTYKFLQKKNGVLLIRAIADMFMAAIAEPESEPESEPEK